MGSAIVPDHDDRTAQMTKQVAKKPANLSLLDVLTVQLAIQSKTTTRGTDRHGGDRGDLVVFVRVSDERSHSANSPGTADGRNQEISGFVNKREVGIQPRRFFFIRGQSCRFHASMAASSRWVARRSGFWQLQPNA